MGNVRFGSKADKCNAQTHVRLRPQSGNFIVHLPNSSTLPAQRAKGRIMHSAHRKLQQLDRVIVLHAAAHALGRVEQHVGFRRVGIPQHRDAGTVDDEVAAVEIASPRFDRITNGCRLSLCG